MLQASQLMIHEAWGVAIGPASDLRAFADLLDQQNEVIAGIYANRSGGEVAKFLELMAAETWLTDQQSVELGLADSVLTPEAKAAATARPLATTTTSPAPVAAPAPAPAPPVFDATDHLDREWVREMFGSTALAD